MIVHGPTPLQFFPLTSEMNAKASEGRGVFLLTGGELDRGDQRTPPQGTGKFSVAADIARIVPARSNAARYPAFLRSPRGVVGRAILWEGATDLEYLGLLADEWQEEARQLRDRYGDERGAKLCETHAAELRVRIRDHLDEPLTLKEAAAESGYSVSHLQLQ
jgi:hypothetical protein